MADEVSISENSNNAEPDEPAEEPSKTIVDESDNAKSDKADIEACLVPAHHEVESLLADLTKHSVRISALTAVAQKPVAASVIATP